MEYVIVLPLFFEIGVNQMLIIPYIEDAAKRRMQYKKEEIVSTLFDYAAERNYEARFQLSILVLRRMLSRAAFLPTRAYAS